ncbi:MAG: hypothetical protein AB1938_27895 [Myxococcota bacterium]
MKRIAIAALTFAALQACAIRVPGINIGTPGAESSSGGSSAQESILDSAQTRAWREVLRSKDDELDALYERLNDVPKEGSTSPDQHAEWSLKLIKNDQLADVAAGCAAGTYTGEETKLDERRAHLHAATMCPLVTDRMNLLKKNVHAWGVAIIDYYFWQESNRIERMEKEKRVSVGLLAEPQSAQKLKDYVASFAKKTFEAIGEPVPEEALKKAEELFAKRQDTIMKLAAAGKMTTSAKADAGAEKAIKDVYAKRFDVKKVVMKDAEWKLVKNDLGILLRHYKDADVLVRRRTAPSAPWCPPPSASRTRPPASTPTPTASTSSSRRTP